jgi:hypothetical protein
MKKRLSNHGIAIMGIAILVFFAMGCLTIPPPEPVENLPPISVKDKATAFALALYLIDQRGYEILVEGTVRGDFIVNARPRFDYENGSIVTKAIRINDDRVDSWNYRASAEFLVTPDNVLDVRLVNRRKFTNDTDTQSSLLGEDANVFFGRLRNDIITALNSLQSNPDTLEKCMDHFLSDFSWNRLILGPLTAIGRETFVKEYLINRTYKWKLRLSDFQENKNSKYNKQYVAIFGDDLRLYTNDSALGSIPRNQVVEYAGTLAGIDFPSEGPLYHFFTTDGR